MDEFKIATGTSRMAKKWKNTTITWENLKQTLSVTKRTPESVEEYRKMKRPERDQIKDIGGFVGGHLSEGVRKSNTVLCRSLVSLDMDEGTPEFIESGLTKIPYRALVYSTHKHTPQAPRLRIIIPLTREVSPEEYEAVSRMLAKTIGIDMFDDTTYQPSRLMYWPSTSSNGQFFFQELKGKDLNPDEILAMYNNWHDCSTWPTSSRQSECVKSEKTKQKDPREAKGIIGAFCRTYGVIEAIDKFLPDVYTPSAMRGRYDYIPADSSAGVVVYDNLWAYSHHATDPASGHLLNAFYLVMYHKFGEDGYADMAKFASEDEEVKLLMTNERLESIGEDFKDETVNDDWKKKLTFVPRSNVIENNVPNLSLILNNDPDFKNFAHNDFARMVEITGDVPWERTTTSPFWTDNDTAQLKKILDTKYTAFSTRNHDVAFSAVVSDRHFHPIRTYINSLPEWDGIERIDDLFIRYLGAENSDYVKTVTRKTFVAAIARILDPGCKFDCIPVLDGAQGIGKSTIIKDLITAPYYSDALSLTDMDGKDGAEKLQGFWCIEIGELAGMKKADIEKVKAFITTQDDKYRPSYGRVVECHPRQCIIIATVNGERGYLRDVTGNRRFWIIKLGKTEQTKNWNFDEYFRSQFWAEALYYYNQGEKLYLEGDMIAEAEIRQKGAMEMDERLGIVEEYLNTLLPENWDDMDLFKRLEYLEGDPTSRIGTVKRNMVTNHEIWCECFKKAKSDIKTPDSYQIAALMTQIPGWEKSQKTVRVPIYGKQRVYIRKENG